MKRAITILTGVLALGACDNVHINKQIRIGDTEVAEPLKPAGAPATLAADADVNLQWSAGVVKIDELKDQGDTTVKLFGTAGGDPAMNGLYTYVAFFVGPAEGWAVFKVGDFLDYKVLGEGPGHVDLEIDESTMDEATGQIGSRKRRVIVGWTAGADGAAPASVSVTPAQ
ncbi:MAG: hypothetical protein ACK4FG_03680 [Brevundimonas sp.]